MTWLNSAITIQDAVVRGLDVYELIISNWGNAGAPSADGTSLMFPANGQNALPSVFGVAIGPKSHVDRIFVAYDLQVLLIKSATYDTLRRVSIVSPLMFPQAGSRALISVPPNSSSTIILYAEDVATDAPNSFAAYEDSAVFGTSYVKSNGTQSTWGMGAPGFRPPILQLYLYLRTPVIAPATKRVPYINRAFTALTNPAAVDVMLAQFPTYGRTKAIVDISRFGGAANLDFRIGSIRLTNIFTPFVLPREITVGSISAMVPNSSQRLLIDNPGDWLFMYYTTADVAGDITVDITAVD